MRNLSTIAIFSLGPVLLTAQVASDRDVSLKNWAAPLYWQPTSAENEASGFRPEIRESAPKATTPVGSLVFVAMTPCRVVDTRTGQGFAAPFGPPSLVANATRSFPLQSSGACTIPSTAQAYSLNVTVIPPASLGYVKVWPTGVAEPNAVTLDDVPGDIRNNAAIVAAGTPNGSIDVKASAITDFVIDINGYYAPSTGITLAQGTASAPSLSFTGDAGTGIYSSGTGALNLSTGGTNRLTVRSDGDLDLAGNIRKGGTLFLNNLGTDNTALGLAALSANITGTDNTAVGFNAMQSNVQGNFNTASGSQALFGPVIGSNNTAIGYFALHNNNIGNNNTATGSLALQHNDMAAETVGHDNTANGYSALSNNVSGSHNTIVGSMAMPGSSVGEDNTALGANALFGITNGSRNIGIGKSAGSAITTGNDNIEIGNTGVAGDSGVIRVGTSGTQTKFFAAGVRATPVTGGLTVMVDANGQLGILSSSRRYKEDIQDMDAASNGLLRLRPVMYRYKRSDPDGSQPVDYGLIAEEVAEVYPDLVVKNAEGQIETVQYHKLIPMLLNELQKERKIRDQQTELLQAEVSALRKTLETQIASKATVE